MTPVTLTSSILGQVAGGSSRSFHHDQTSSVTYGMNGANNLSSTSRAVPSAAFADAAPASPLEPYARSFTSST